MILGKDIGLRVWVCTLLGKSPQSLYRATSSISYHVVNYLSRPWGTDISDAIFRSCYQGVNTNFNYFTYKVCVIRQNHLELLIYKTKLMI